MTLSRLRLTRLDVFLIAAFLAANVAQVAVGIAGRAEEKQRAAWQKQEQKVQEEIKGSLSISREELEERVRKDPALWWRFQIGFFLMVVVFGAALYRFFRVLFLLWKRRFPEPAMGAPPPPAWGLREILRLALLAAVVSEVILLAQWGLARWLHPAWLDRHVAALTNTLLLDAVVLVGAWRLLTRKTQAPYLVRVSVPGTGVGSAGLGTWPAVKFAARSYLTFLPLIVLLLWGIAALLDAMKIKPSPQPIFTMYLAENRGAVLASLLVLVTLVGPAAEEVFFRGLVHTWLRKKIGVGRSIAVSALVFALLHNDPVAFFPILGLGLVFGWVYERTGSLAAPVAVHVLHNGGMLYFASLVKSLS